MPAPATMVVVIGSKACTITLVINIKCNTDEAVVFILNQVIDEDCFGNGIS